MHTNPSLIQQATNDIQYYLSNIQKNKDKVVIPPNPGIIPSWSSGNPNCAVEVDILAWHAWYPKNNNNNNNK